MHLLFPVGDTFKFDLTIYNSLDGTGEPYTTVTVSGGLACEGVRCTFALVVTVYLAHFFVVRCWIQSPYKLTREGRRAQEPT